MILYSTDGHASPVAVKSFKGVVMYSVLIFFKLRLLFVVAQIAPYSTSNGMV